MHKGTILQQDGTYTIILHIPGGVITDPELLIRIADVAQKHHVPTLKFTSGQRIALVGLKEEDIDVAWTDLGIEPGVVTGKYIRRIKFCPGITFCKQGLQDSLGLGSKIDQKYHGMTLPNKFKISVSGCPRKCMDTLINDVGFMGTTKGWTLYVGGNGGINPRFADLLAVNIGDQRALELLEQTLAWYKAHAKATERLGKTIERLGLEVLKAALQ